MTTRHGGAGLLLLLCLLPCAGAAAGAQESAPSTGAAVAPAPVPGDTVRLVVGPPTQRRRGTVVAVAPDAITLRFRGADTTALVPWSRIYRIEASRGRGPSSENLARGAVGGAFVGVSVAYLFFSPDAGLIGRRAAAGGALGALAGTAVALWRPGPRRWAEVFRPGAPTLPDVAARGTPSATSSDSRVSLTVQWSVVPMKPATSSLGTSPAPLRQTIAANGLTVRAGSYGLIGGPLPYLEAFYSHTAGREAHGTPELNSLGVLVGGWTTRSAASSRLSGFGGAGLALLRARAWGVPPCTSAFCIGNVRYGDGTLVTAVADIGALVRLVEIGPGRRALGLRADGRLHLPVSPKGDAGASARTRGEVARGLQVEL